MDKRSRTARKALLASIGAGIRKHFAAMPEVIIASRRTSPSALASVFQAELDAIVAVEKAEALRKKARLDERKAYKENRVLHAALERFVRGAFADARALADFGYKPEKKPRKPVEAKAQALAKATATRTARGTTGPKQRRRIRG